jgi:hypothetical protein
MVLPTSALGSSECLSLNPIRYNGGFEYTSCTMEITNLANDCTDLSMKKYVQNLYVATTPHASTLDANTVVNVDLVNL